MRNLVLHCHASLHTNKHFIKLKLKKQNQKMTKRKIIFVKKKNKIDFALKFLFSLLFIL